MTVARSVDDAVCEHVRFQVERIDREAGYCENPRRSRWRMPTTPEDRPRLPAAAGPELWMQRVRGFSAMN